MFLFGLWIGVVSVLGITMNNDQEVGILDTNVAEYQCSMEDGLESVTAEITKCNNGTVFTKS